LCELSRWKREIYKKKKKEEKKSDKYNKKMQREIMTEKTNIINIIRNISKKNN